MRRRRLGFALMALAVGVAAGCGGADDDTTSAAKTEAGTTTKQSQGLQANAKTGKPAQKGRGSREKQGDSSADAQATIPPFQQPDGPAPTESGSLPNEGTKRRAPGVPVRKYTDSSVQTYGLEAPSAERIEAARLLQAFLNARLDGDWALACSYLSEPIKAEMQALIDGDRKESVASACLRVMAGFGQGVPQEQLRIGAEIEVLSMRVEGDSAIVIYRDGSGAPFTIPMTREDGAWKVSAAAGSVLVLGA